MSLLAADWISEVSRGPDWLFVRLAPDAPISSSEALLAENICGLLEQQFLNRLVLELDELDRLQSELIGQLVLLHKRIVSRGGVMRITGLSEPGQQVLRMSRLETRFPCYTDRHAAVMGYRPEQPR